MKRFDVIVVGAGTGGCVAAKTVAEAGLEVCLIDRKGKEDIGIFLDLPGERADLFLGGRRLFAPFDLAQIRGLESYTFGDPPDGERWIGLSKLLALIP